MMALPVSAAKLAVHPRYESIYRADCQLTTHSDGSADVNAWVEFAAGEDCDIRVELKRDGRVVRSWSTGSSSGYVEVDREASNLSPGDYQAIMYVTCGLDKDTVTSSIEQI